MGQFIEFRFDEKKTAQVVNKIAKHSGGRISKLRLMKLMYLIDKEAMRRWHRPVTGDTFCSMDHGPILSVSLNLINGDATSQYWNEKISVQAYDVLPDKSLGEDELCRAEIELIDQVMTEFGKLSNLQLIDLTHEFSEWKDPNHSSLIISYEEVFQDIGLTEEQIEDIAIENRFDNEIDRKMAAM